MPCPLDLGLFVILSINIAIYYFLSHVETFITSEYSRLSMPGWLPKFKIQWMLANFIVGNLCLWVRIAMQRVFLSGLMHIVESAQLVVLGPVLYLVSRRVSKQLEALYDECVDVGDRDALFLNYKVLTIFTYNGPEMKLESSYRASKIQLSDPFLRS